MENPQKTKIKIDKRKARKLYEEGITIFVIPHKINISSPWASFFEMKKSKSSNSFDWAVDNFLYYNSTFELGYYPSFYIEEA